MQSEPRLPTYEEAAGQSDYSKLPSYNLKRRARFHPYSRYVPIVINEADRLFACFLPALSLRALIISLYHAEHCF